MEHTNLSLENQPVLGGESSLNSETGGKPIYHSSLPNVPDMRQLDNDQTQEIMAKLRAKLSTEHCRLLKLQRSPDGVTDEIMEMSIQVFNTHQCMQMLSNCKGVSMYFEPPPPPPVKINENLIAKPSTDANPSEEKVSLDSQTPAQGKRPYEAELNADVSGQENSDWSLVKYKRTKSKNSNPPSRGATSSINDEKMDLTNSNDNKIAKKVKIPPFFIIPPDHWATLLITLRTMAKTLSSSSQGKFLKLETGSDIDFRTVQQLLNQYQIPYKSFPLEEDKPVKAVVRGLPIRTPVELIKEHLELEGFTDITVTQMYRGSVSNKQLMPLYHISMPKKQNVNIDELFNLDNLMGTKVRVEIYRGKKGPSQCHNCQGFFHSARYCKLPPKCNKCTGSHLSSACDKPAHEPVVCCHCAGNHPSNYRLCPRWPTTSKKPNIQNSKTKISTFNSKKVEPSRSFAAAANGISEASPSPSINIPNSSAPSIGAHSAADFISYLLAFEKSYHPDIVLAALEKALPELRSAPTEADRIFILYRSIRSISKTG